MVNPGTYAAMSAVCAVAVIYHAFSTRRQFYPVLLYLSHSKISLLFLLNMGFVMMCGMWQLVNSIFLGVLRETEVERLNEQVWREIMEILFAMTVFRDEFNIYFLFLITVLLFIKAHHWLAQKRVEYIILVSTTIGTFIKYALHMGETYMEGRFSRKAVCLFYLELVQDLLHLSLYLLFFLVIFMFYGLPLHSVRELYETFRNFKRRIADYLRYRRLTYNMNERFADASAEDLSRDATCIVCREDMVEAKKLPCGHLFHVHCLRQWLERQYTCPTCRAPVLALDDEPSVEDQPFDDDIQADEGEVDFTHESEGETGDGENYGGPAVPNATNWSEVQAAATTAAANYGTSFVLPVLSHGYAIWYPMLLPRQRDGDLLGRDNLVRSEGAGQRDNVSTTVRSETYAPAVMVVAQNQHDVIQRWIWKNAITQTAELVMQLQQNAMQLSSLAHVPTSTSIPAGEPNSSFASLVQEREEEATRDQSQHNAVDFVVQNDARLAYLRGVSEILRKHLQHNLELQHQISAVTVEQVPSVSGGTGGDALNQGLGHHLHGPGENCKDCEFRCHVNALETIDRENGLLSISTNPLNNSSLQSSSSSSTEKAERTEAS